MSGLRVGVVGATGAVGRELLHLIDERRFPLGEIRAFASERSAGSRIPFAGGDIGVEAIEPGVFADLDLALFTAGGDLSRALGRVAADQDCIVVDNSSAFRMDDDVPLVIPEINPEALEGHRNLIANPNCTTIVNAMVAAPLHRAFGVERMVVASYQAASGAGAKGLRELMAGTRGHLDGNEPKPEVFAAPLAFNVVPMIGDPADDGVTSEERKMRDETRKILGADGIDVVCTCVRVPVARAHGVAATVWLSTEIDVGQAEAVIDEASGVSLDPMPTPRAVSGEDAVRVGRLRVADFDPRIVSYFAVGDQVRKGAALNALQISEHLVGATRHG